MSRLKLWSCALHHGCAVKWESELLMWFLSWDLHQRRELRCNPSVWNMNGGKFSWGAKQVASPALPGILHSLDRTFTHMRRNRTSQREREDCSLLCIDSIIRPSITTNNQLSNPATSHTMPPTPTSPGLQLYTHINWSVPRFSNVTLQHAFC